MNNVFMSEAINEIAAALCKVQGLLEPAKKTSTNSFFKNAKGKPSTYAGLAETIEVSKKLLFENGISVIQCPSAKGNEVTVTTMFLHVSGQFISSSLTTMAKDAGPQAIGSCISYLRRYGLKAMLNMADEDDDGEAGENRSKPVFEAKKDDSALKDVVFDGKNPTTKGMVHGYMKQYKVNQEHMAELAGQLIGKKMGEIEQYISQWVVG
jgi:hypothetical protein